MKTIFEILQILFGHLGDYAKEKKYIFLFYSLSTIFSVVMFISIENYAAVLPVLTTGIRYFIFIFRDRYKTILPLIICLAMHVAGLIISTNTLIDMIPSILVIIGCFIYWYLDNEKLKGTLFLLNILWILYYFYFELYIVCMNAIVSNIIIGIAYIQLKQRKKEINNGKRVKKKSKC